MWEPQPLATIRASTACTGIALPFGKPIFAGKPEEKRPRGGIRRRWKDVNEY
jgi:hypothetical protein